MSFKLRLYFEVIPSIKVKNGVFKEKCILRWRPIPKKYAKPKERLLKSVTILITNSNKQFYFKNLLIIFSEVQSAHFQHNLYSQYNEKLLIGNKPSLVVFNKISMYSPRTLLKNICSGKPLQKHLQFKNKIINLFVWQMTFINHLG